MKNLLLIGVLGLLIVTIGCDEDEVNNDPPSDQEVSPDKMISDLLGSYALLDTSMIMNYVLEDGFIQHNLSFTDGREGMIEAVVQGPLKGARVDISRMMQDGDFVATHSEYLFGSSVVVFNVYRFSDNKIVEHWDNLQPMQNANISGHTMLDGTMDIDKTANAEANKTIARNFIERIMIGRKTDDIEGFFSANTFIQHNPTLQDSVSHLKSLLEQVDTMNSAFSYSTLHQVIGEGDFALTLSEGTWEGSPAAFYDLFRLEEGKIAEHWDVIQTIPPQSEWAHNNGKF